MSAPNRERDQPFESRHAWCVVQIRQLWGGRRCPTREMDRLEHRHYHPGHKKTVCNIFSTFNFRNRREMGDFSERKGDFEKNVIFVSGITESGTDLYTAGRGRSRDAQGYLAYTAPPPRKTLQQEDYRKRDRLVHSRTRSWPRRTGVPRL